MQLIRAGLYLDEIVAGAVGVRAAVAGTHRCAGYRLPGPAVGYVAGNAGRQLCLQAGCEGQTCEEYE
jgi:hypothetical protein